MTYALTTRSPRPSDDVTILVDGVQLGGWMTVSITRGLEIMPSSFLLTMTERYPQTLDAMQIKPGQACQVFAGDDLVLTGYIDLVRPTLTAQEHMVTIAGRSKCADLVDCSAEWPSGQIDGSDVFDIAQNLAAPYGIFVRTRPDANIGAPVPQFALNIGDTPWEIIERICRYRQLLAYDDTAGNLVLDQLGSSSAASGVAEGVNVESASVSLSAHLRYSQYQGWLNGMDTLSDQGVLFRPVQTYSDPGVTRHRVLSIVPPGIGTDWGGNVAEDRLVWEALRRAARSHIVAVTVDNWRDSAGTLFTPNTYIEVELPSLHVPDVNWLISEVTYRKDQSGTHCDLVIMPPSAFIPQPEVPFFLSAEYSIQ